MFYKPGHRGKFLCKGAALFICSLIVFFYNFGSVRAGTEENQPVLSFGMTADVQYADIGPSLGRHYRKSIGKLSAAVEKFNSMDLAFVVDLGDVIDRGKESFTDVMEIYGGLRHPLYIALGNHDFPVSYDHTLESLQMEENYFDFQVENWRFIVLDANDISLIARPENSAEYKKAEAMLASLRDRNAPNARRWNGAIGSDQLDWLEKTLLESAENNEKVVIFCHYPIYPPGRHNLWNYEEVLSLLNQSQNVVAWFNGHNHAGNYGKSGGIHCVTLQGMVETADENAFARVDLYPDRLELTGYGREPGRVLHFK